MDRDDKGHIVADPEKFPDGIADLADYIHNTTLKFGLYSSRGTMTCAGRPGGQGYEVMDANDYASWGVDYLKYDNCYIDGVSAQESYTTMSNALNATGREIFFSLCNWGNEDVSSWAPGIA
jgi:alpha-galactosidase